MNASNSRSFEEAQARAERVLTSVRSGGGGAGENETGEYVVFAGRVTAEGMWGVGADFICDDIYVRVHGLSKVPFTFSHPCVAWHVRVLGRLVNVYVPQRVLVISVTPEDYDLVGTT